MSIEEKKRRLAEKLREHRLRNNLSGRAFAKKLKLNPTSLMSYMDETSFPSPETREKIAEAIGMTGPELEAYLDDIPLRPLKPVDQLKQDIRALNQADFLEVAAVVNDRLLSDARSHLERGR